MMIIACPLCKKNFEIDQKLIPLDGRMVQCGSCDNQWFFKFKDETKINKEETPKEETSIDEVSKEEFTIEESLSEKKVDINIEETNLTDENTVVQNKNKLNYFNIILVGIISFIAFILILETFKVYLSSIFPNIEILLNNLYQSLEDMKLFILDLIK